jgi:hypothetical protein
MADGCARHTARRALLALAFSALAQVAHAAPGTPAPELAPYLRAAGVGYPPRALVLLALKRERRLELYAGSSAQTLRFVRDYPLLGLSGTIGPKRAEGDRQVPEGIYRIVGLNPNSRFHRSLELDYPNGFDRDMARRDGRSRLGGEIFIHGGSASEGCLAVGNRFAEEIYELVRDAGPASATVILSPWDFRTSAAPPPATAPAWTGLLYERIHEAIRHLPLARW